MTTAAIYCRISSDPDGLREGVERQQTDCRALAEREGYTVAGVWTDNDLGASTLSRKPRPQYEAMLGAARRGELGVIIAYSNSRLTRRLRDLEDLIQLHDQHGVRVLTVVSGEDNLATADGRMVARIKASVDAAEAERTSERIRRAFLQHAHEGRRPNGPRPFGWQPDKIHLHPIESAAIIEAADDVLAGVPLRAIARDWGARGLTTARGNPWHHTKLRDLLQRPRLVGWRTHHGEPLTVNGAPVEGEWEPILDRDTYDRLRAFLAARSGARVGARRYLLSGIARCGVCGGRLHGMATKGGRHDYRCRTENAGHTVGIDGPHTDRLILDLVKLRLESQQLTAPAPARLPGADRADAIPGLIAELMAAYNAQQISGSVAFPQVARLEAELAGLQTERARHLAAAVTVTVTADDLDGLDIDRQRAAIEALLDAVVVAPAARKGQRWTPDRLSAVWR